MREGLTRTVLCRQGHRSGTLIGDGLAKGEAEAVEEATRSDAGRTRRTRELAPEEGRGRTPEALEGEAEPEEGLAAGQVAIGQPASTGVANESLHPLGVGHFS